MKAFIIWLAACIVCMAQENTTQYSSPIATSGWLNDETAISPNASMLAFGNVISLGDTTQDPCRYSGTYDPKTKACVLVIRFARMDHLVCTGLQNAEPQDKDDDRIISGTQQITCMYDPKE